jgi:hypothetical protein
LYINCILRDLQSSSGNRKRAEGEESDAWIGPVKRSPCYQDGAKPFGYSFGTESFGFLPITHPQLYLNISIIHDSIHTIIACVKAAISLPLNFLLPDSRLPLITRGFMLRVERVVFSTLLHSSEDRRHSNSRDPRQGLVLRLHFPQTSI